MTQTNPFFNSEVTFLRGVLSVEDFPDSQLPEIAFAGRSNVGKSSLLNALLNSRKVARVSNTPGRTREINFFNLSDKTLFVDLPGYGYAVTSKKTRIIWDNLIKMYLRGRTQLKRVFLLIDSRHSYKESDFLIMKLLDDAAVSYQIVLTKTDKVANLEDVISYTLLINKDFAAVHPKILSTSAKNFDGIKELQTEITNVINNVMNADKGL